MTPIVAGREPTASEWAAAVAGRAQAQASLNYREEPIYLTEDTDLYCLDDSLFPIIEEEAEE